MRTSFVVISLLVACSKSSSEQTGSAATPSSGSSGPSGSSAAPGSAGSSAAPVEAAAVVGPTRSVSGVLELGGLMSGKFQWIKKDQKSPISCAWSAEKEIGGLHVDLSDGAGHLVQMTIDIPPVDVGMPRLDVTSTGLPAPLKTKFGFNMSGDGSGHMEVKFDATLTQGDTEDAPAAKGKGAKQAAKPSGPSLTIKGTLEVTCPPKK